MIKKNTKLAMLGSVFLIFFILLWRVAFIAFDENLKVALSINCICAFIIYTWLFFCIYKMDKGIVNVYSGFVLLSFVFYFGQHLVVLLGRSEALAIWFRSILDGRIPNYNRINTGYYILVVMLVINIGVQCGLHFNNYRKVNQRIKKTDVYNKCVEFVASVILAVVTVPTYYILYFNAQKAIELGYSAAKQAAAVEGILKLGAFLSYFFLPAIYMLLIAYSDSKKKYVIMVMYAIYVILYLGSGSRFKVFESAVALVLIYNYKYKKIKLRDMTVLGVLGYIGVALLVLLRNIRGVLNSVSGFSELVSSAMTKMLNEGVITGALIETGATFQIVDVVLYKCPSAVDFCYGKSMLSAILRVFPSFLRFDLDLDAISTSKVFGPLYVSEIKVGMGSSFIAESYYNFGIFSLLFVFVLGVLIGKMLTSFNEECKPANNFQLFQHVYISSMLCFAVRTDLVTIPRYYFYYAFLVQVLILIVYQRRMRY